MDREGRRKFEDYRRREAGPVENTVIDRLGADAIQRAIDRLPPQFRTTVQLSDVEGLSYAEIADATGVAKGTVMKYKSI